MNPFTSGSAASKKKKGGERNTLGREHGWTWIVTLPISFTS